MGIKIPNLTLPGEEEIKETVTAGVETVTTAAADAASDAQEAVQGVADVVNDIVSDVNTAAANVAAAVQEAPSVVEETVAEALEPVSEDDDSLNFNNLSPEEQAAVLAFVDRIDIHDSETVLKYGNAAQVKISQFADEILKDVKD